MLHHSGNRRDVVVAEIKLMAEREIGNRLGKMGLHGGNRKSSYGDGNLKLSDLGLTGNQSSQYQLAAREPLVAGRLMD